MKQNEDTRLSLIKQYELSSEDTLFSEDTVAAVRQCSIYTIERDRWVGIGVPFIKLGRLVRYRKSDIRAWLAAQPVVRSKTQFQLLSEKAANEVNCATSDE